MEIGDHLVSPRVGYSHHGIYIGNSQVIHYSGFVDGMSSGAIEITSLKDFSRGQKIKVKKHIVRTYSPEESVQRAYSRLGEDWYNVLLNNCEHFVTWCIVGIHSSSQVNSAIAAAAVLSKIKPASVAAEPVVSVIAGSAGKAVSGKAGSALAAGVMKSVVGASGGNTAGIVAGAATGAGLASATGAGASVVASIAAGSIATAAAPLALTVVAAAGVGYGAKKLYDWIFD